MQSVQNERLHIANDAASKKSKFITQTPKSHLGVKRLWRLAVLLTEDAYALLHRASGPGNQQDVKGYPLWQQDYIFVQLRDNISRL